MARFWKKGFMYVELTLCSSRFLTLNITCMNVTTIYIILAIVMFCIYRIAAYHANSEVKLKKAADRGKRRSIRVRA